MVLQLQALDARGEFSLISCAAAALHSKETERERNQHRATSNGQTSVLVLSSNPGLLSTPQRWTRNTRPVSISAASTARLWWQKYRSCRWSLAEIWVISSYLNVVCNTPHVNIILKLNSNKLKIERGCQRGASRDTQGSVALTSWECRLREGWSDPLLRNVFFSWGGRRGFFKHEKGREGGTELNEVHAEGVLLRSSTAELRGYER